MSNIVVPQLGESVVEARVARWLKKVGDSVAVGEPVVELETEKIDLEVGAEHAGRLASITRQEGEDVKVGEVLAVVEDGAAGTATEPPPAPSEVAPVVATSAPSSDGTRATPTARRIAQDAGVALEQVQGTGAGGRVTKQDVERALAPQAAAPTPVVPPESPPRASGERREERIRMSKRRQTIARRLVEAQQTAAILTTFNEVDMSAIMALRARRKESFKKTHGVGLGIASFFVKASVAALKAFPQLNAEIQGDEIVLKHFYDIGMAVGAEGGLVVPVLHDADEMSFADVEGAIRQYAGKAQDGTLTLTDLTGGTFTITNGGVFGSLLSTPILNPPQVGILGLHKIQDRAIAVAGQVVVKPMMYMALSYDHRIVDGREAVQFLSLIKDFIEDPGHLLLEN